jgi:hypothetical protein
MRRLAVMAAVAAVLAGCGSGSGRSHSYVVVPTGNGVVAKGVYITLVSPVAIPARVLKTSGVNIVAEPRGPQVCSYTKPFQGLPNTAAFLNGKIVTLRLNGSIPLVKVLCSILKKGRTFSPTSIGTNGGGYYNSNSAP